MESKTFFSKTDLERIKQLDKDSIFLYISSDGSSRRIKTSKGTFLKHYLDLMSKLRSDVCFFEKTHDDKEVEIIRFKRHKRGKVLCNGEEYKTFEFLSSLNDFFEIITTEKDMKFFQRFIRKHTEEKLIKKSTTPSIEVDLANFPTTKEVDDDCEDFVFEEHFDGKRQIIETGFAVENKLPAILTNYEDVGKSKAFRFAVVTISSGRKSWERFNVTALEPSLYENSLKRLFNKISPSFSVYYQCSKSTYLKHFFTIEYTEDAFAFSYTLQKANNNFENTVFAKIYPENVESIEPFAYKTLAAFFGLSLTDFVDYFQTKLKEMSEINSECHLTNPELNEWLKENQFNLTAWRNIDVKSAEELVALVKKGIEHISKEVPLERFRKLNTINITESSWLGMYHHFVSKLSFNISLIDIGTSGYSTIFHEYGHLIHFSLMNGNVVGSQQKAKENALKIQEFLKDYKNCSYIDKSKKKHKVQYYQKDTELFARLFESYMLFKTDMYDEVFTKKKNLNTKEETMLFVEFLNNEFSLNLTLAN